MAHALVLIAILLQVVLAESVCQYGLTYMDECDNECTCINEESYLCTENPCHAGATAGVPQYCDDSQLLPDRDSRRVFCFDNVVRTQPEDESCLEGSTFRDNCNSCYCGKQGLVICTQIECSTDEPAIMGCPHSAAFLDECGNICSCVDDDFYACTFGACGYGETPETPRRCDKFTYLPEVPGHKLVCRDDIIQVVLDECKYGTEYIDECNGDCVCSDGKYVCTNSICSPGSVPRHPMRCDDTMHLPSRTGRRVFCLHDVVRAQQLDDPCEKGSVYRDDCNFCTCTSSGFPLCTLKDCSYQINHHS